MGGSGAGSADLDASTGYCDQMRCDFYQNASGCGNQTGCTWESYDDMPMEPGSGTTPGSGPGDDMYTGFCMPSDDISMPGSGDLGSGDLGSGGSGSAGGSGSMMACMAVTQSECGEGCDRSEEHTSELQSP